MQLIKKNKTSLIKGFTLQSKKVNGTIQLDHEFKPVFKNEENTEKLQTLKCPKCHTGTMIKGKSAWGCSRYKEECRFVIPFDVLQKSFLSDELTVAFLYSVSQ